MKVCDYAKKLNLTIFSGEGGQQNVIIGGYVSDLLSDVMGNACEGQLWITLQTHLNTLAVASLKEMAAIVLVAGNKPDADTMNKSNEEGIPILGTSLSCFEITGKTYQLLAENDLV
ncbi:MAG: serine kinase [Bacteroidales bacterium]|nr:serine kinase [Bacteroidales bacterium]